MEVLVSNTQGTKDDLCRGFRTRKMTEESPVPASSVPREKGSPD